jgi:hypothetical protein
MTFGPFPAALQNAIQQNFLEREFEKALQSILQYRKIAERESFAGRIGETITKTRIGLMIPNVTPLDSSTNTNLDNGLNPQYYTSEQYTLGIAQYPQLAPDINLIDDETTIASFAMKNAFNLGYAIAQATDRIARNALFNAYMSGNTFVTATLGAPATTIDVDDTRGFQTVVVNGVVTPVSVSNPLPVYINGTSYNITAFANDVVNVSTAATTGGTSGTITASVNISVANGTVGNAVIGVYAPAVLRPNARAATVDLQTTDTLDMPTLFNAINVLRNNAVPTIDGMYNIYLNSTSMTQLFQDPEFQILNRGVGTQNPNYRKGVITEFLDMRFIQTTETYVQTTNFTSLGGTLVTVQRPIVCGADALIEGQFDKGMDAIRAMSGNTGQTSETIIVADYDGFYQYLRKPLDRLGQIISQTSNWVGGYTVPTDVGTTSAIIPTANNAYYKRCVVIETA